MLVISADESFLALSDETLHNLCSSTREEIRVAIKNNFSGQITEKKLRRLLKSWEYGWLKREDNRLNSVNTETLIQHPTYPKLVKPLNRRDIRHGLESGADDLAKAANELLALYYNWQPLNLTLASCDRVKMLVTLTSDNIRHKTFEIVQDEQNPATAVEEYLRNSSILALRTDTLGVTQLLSALKTQQITGTNPDRMHTQKLIIDQTTLQKLA